MDDWGKWQQLVLHKLDEHSDYHEKHLDHLHKLELEVATLKVRAGLWGAIAGSLTTIAALLAKIFIHP